MRLLLLALVASCNGGGRVRFRVPPDAGAPCQPREVAARDTVLFDALASRTLADEPVDAGDYANDFGDAPAYAPPVLSALGDAHCDQDAGASAEETLSYGKRRVATFADDLSPEAILAALGFIETYRLSPRD